MEFTKAKEELYFMMMRSSLDGYKFSVSPEQIKNLELENNTIFKNLAKDINLHYNKLNNKNKIDILNITKNIIDYGGPWDCLL